MSYYYSYNDYLQEKFGCRVYKVSIDAGFTCPNRDGSKGVGGCIFCDETGSSARTHCSSALIREQILNNIGVRRTRYGAEKFIAYFQSFTNTYAPPSYLKSVYDEAVHAHPDIVGLAISTRADSVDEEKLDLIASYRERLPYVCVEYGLQTIHDETLRRIHRCETLEEVERALIHTQTRQLEHCVHVILGLPGETAHHVRETARWISSHHVQGVKVHVLVAMEGTPLANHYRLGLWHPLTMEEAVELTCDFLERIPPSCIVYRVGGNGHPKHVVAPRWVWEKKKAFGSALLAEFQRRGTRQGSKHLSP